jgi:CDP-diglyceride synthetase
VNLFQLFEKIRIWLYGGVLILFTLDFITTAIGVNQGLIEQNWIIATFVNDLTSHFAVKMLICFVVIYLLELKFRYDKKVCKMNEYFYGLLIFVLFLAILYYIFVVVNNVGLIIKT